ncbi:hypothetical protein ACWDOR_44430 [Streptosporangium canum]
MPVLAATAACAGLGKPKSFVDEECPAKGCRPLRVIAVARGEATMPSSRGGEVRVKEGNARPGQSDVSAGAMVRRHPAAVAPVSPAGPGTARPPGRIPSPPSRPASGGAAG